MIKKVINFSLNLFNKILLTLNPEIKKKRNYLKVKMWTHTDLDAGGCVILGKTVFKNINVTYCDYNTINSKVAKFIEQKEYEEYDLFFITDINVNDEVANLLDAVIGDKLLLIDHHSSEKERLSKYKWSFIDKTHKSLLSPNETDLSSATTLLYQYFIENNLLFKHEQNKLFDLVEMIRQYDTWDWKNKTNNIIPKQLNDLFYIIGRHKFVERFLTDSSIFFNETESNILEIENEKIKRYLIDKSKELVVIDILQYKAGVVFAEQFASEIGNLLAEKFPKLDFIVLIEPGKKRISYRSIKLDINLGNDVAATYGGGGHPQSAGSQITQEKIEQFIHSLFL